MKIRPEQARAVPFLQKILDRDSPFYHLDEDGLSDEMEEKLRRERLPITGYPLLACLLLYELHLVEKGEKPTAFPKWRNAFEASSSLPATGRSPLSVYLAQLPPPSALQHPHQWTAKEREELQGAYIATAIDTDMSWLKTQWTSLFPPSRWGYKFDGKEISWERKGSKWRHGKGGKEKSWLVKEGDGERLAGPFSFSQFVYATLIVRSMAFESSLPLRPLRQSQAEGREEKRQEEDDAGFADSENGAGEAGLFEQLLEQESDRSRRTAEVLVPCLDLINSLTPDLQNAEADGASGKLVSSRELNDDDQVFTCYGNGTNAETLLGYGYVYFHTETANTLVIDQFPLLDIVE
mmetsp:Transcript_30945/g.81271  ORF Transcript_30945/g.81271 Transcript_30945/m.81271 type:complete len:350 (-) Transcript_30945:2508-3557(-)